MGSVQAKERISYMHTKMPTAKVSSEQGLVEAKGRPLERLVGIFKIVGCAISEHR
jgi:hypothetical protein